MAFLLAVIMAVTPFIAMAENDGTGDASGESSLMGVPDSMIYVNAYVFDCMAGEPDLPYALRAPAPVPGVEGLYLVHFTGPIFNEWAEAVSSAGGDIITYVHTNSYEVRMTPEEASFVSSFEFVDWMGMYHPAYKIQQGIGSLDVIVTMNRNQLSLNTADSIASSFESGEGAALPDGHIFIGRLSDASNIYRLAADPDVQFIEEHYPEELHDEMGMQITGGFAWINDPDGNINTPYRTLDNHGSYANQLGWDGSGVVIGIADSGGGDGTTPNMGHVDFTGRVIGGIDLGSTVNGWNDQHGHGTHCAGLMAGDTYEGTGLIYAGAAKYYVAMGQAHEAQVYVEQIFEGTTASFDAPADYGDILTAGYTGGARVHSNSWGSETNGAYSASDQAYDTRVRDASSSAGNQQLIVVCSAGNAGSSLGTIGSPGNGKNVITVGSYYNYMPDATSYGYSSTNRNNPDIVSSFSSRGWSDHTGGGRIKPDVVAPGEATLSTKSPQAASALFGTYTPDGRYQWCSGTSQACPTVSGGAAVIYEWYLATYGEAPTPALTKALLINTAIDTGTKDIPNQNEGWGRMYLPTIVDPTSPFILRNAEPELTTGTYAEYTFQYADPTLPLKVTLAYTDKNAISGDTTPLVNNLDLRLTSPTSQIYHGNAFSAGVTPANTNPITTFDINADGWDETNNVECVYIPAASLVAGQYTLRVTGFSVPGDCDNDGSNDQDYSLVVYNARDVSEAGTIDIEEDVYGRESVVAIEVGDTNLNNNPNSPQTVNINVRSTAEPAGESVTLTETGDDTSMFAGTITISATNSAGVLMVAATDTITATYNDANDGTGSSVVVTDVATIDGSVAATSNLGVDWWGIVATYDYTVSKTLTTGTSSTADHTLTHDQDDTYDLNTERLVTGGGQKYRLLVSYSVTLSAASSPPYTLCIDAFTTGEAMTVTYSVDGGAAQAAGSITQTSDTDTYLTATVNGAVGGSSVTVTFDDLTDELTTMDTLSIDHIYIMSGDGSNPTDHNTLNWTLSADDGAGADDVDHYNIYRSDLQTGPWDASHIITSVPAGTGAYTDKNRGLVDTTYWWYVVRAVDVIGNTDTNTNAVQEPIASNQAPSAPYNPSPSNGATGVALNPALSVTVSDPNGDTMDVSFYSTPGPVLIGTDNNVASGGTATVNWNGRAVHTTYLWYAVANDGSLSTQSSTWSFTTLNNAPTANAGPDQSGTATYLAAFNGAGSSDPDSDSLTYSWTFTYNSSPQTLTGVSPSFSFAIAGVYTVTLTVNDGYGGTDTDTMTVTVNPAPQPPVADAGPNQSGTANYLCTFNGAGSSDPDGSIVSYSWTFTYNAAPQTLTGVSPSFNFQIPGVYTVTLTVTDNSAMTDTDTMTVTVNVNPPTANAGPDQSGTVDYLATFTGAGSSDADGTIVSYSWTFTYNSAPQTLTGVSPTFNFQIAGVYTVTLTVTDDDGATDTDTMTVTVNLLTHNVAYTAGWNLISFAVNTEGGKALSTVFADEWSNIQAIQYYDGEAGEWQLYEAGAPGWMNTLHTADETKGYWVNFIGAGDGILSVQGKAMTSTTIQLRAGWNLVGCPDSTSVAASTVLAGTGYDMLQRFDAGSPYFILDMLPAEMMAPGSAYWVHVPADTSYVVTY